MFFWPIRVYLEDTDAGGIVFYANYLKFMERARTEWLLASGISLDQLNAANTIQCVVRSVQIDYLYPAQLGQLLQLGVAVTDMRRASWTLCQIVRKEDRIICQASVRLACMDLHSLRPVPIPDFLIHILKLNLNKEIYAP